MSKEILIIIPTAIFLLGLFLIKFNMIGLGPSKNANGGRKKYLK